MGSLSIHLLLLPQPTTTHNNMSALSTVILAVILAVAVTGHSVGYPHSHGYGHPAPHGLSYVHRQMSAGPYSHFGYGSQIGHAAYAPSHAVTYGHAYQAPVYGHHAPVYGHPV